MFRTTKAKPLVAKFIALLIVMLVFSCQSAAEQPDETVVPDSSFIISADVSFVQEQEDLGFVYIDNGV